MLVQRFHTKGMKMFIFSINSALGKGVKLSNLRELSIFVINLTTSNGVQMGPSSKEAKSAQKLFRVNVRFMFLKGEQNASYSLIPILSSIDVRFIAHISHQFYFGPVIMTQKLLCVPIEQVYLPSYSSIHC